MRIPNPAVAAILLSLFFIAIWGRLNNPGGVPYPYFKGESATNYRYTQRVMQVGRIPSLDRKAAWPDGYRPAHVKPNGVEQMTGRAFRLAKPFTDVGEKRFVKIFTILFFGLSVFLFYALTYEMWQCRAAGLLAAALIACSGPVVKFTTGETFFHTPYAMVLVSAHLWFFLRFLRKSSVINSLLSSGVAFLLLGFWGPAGAYLALFAAAVVWVPGIDAATRRMLLLSHVVMMLLAGFAWPHLGAQRFVASFPFLFTMAATSYLLVAPRLPKKIPGIAFIAGAVAILMFLARPFNAGDAQPLSMAGYWLQRLKFLAGKPDNPQQLTDTMRFLWDHSHSAPRGHTVFEFFFPLIFLGIAAVPALLTLQKKTRTNAIVCVSVAVIGTILFLLDRRAIPAAAVGIFPLVAACGFGFGKSLKMRVLPVGVGIFLLAAQVFFPFGKPNATYQIAKTIASPDSPDGFLWASLGNADRELIGHIVTRTSVQDVILAHPDVSALVVTFGGRTTVTAPGIFDAREKKRVIEQLSGFFGDEKQLYEACVELGITHVLYSIDLLLHTGEFSPSYTAGFAAVDKQAVARKMHFRPEALSHFQMTYENDNYRLFKVTEKPEPVFLTDHPPVYQRDILERHNDSLSSFYDRIVDVLLTYQAGVDAQAAGDERAAIERFDYVLQQAPKFTEAWLGAGDSFMRLHEIEPANNAYMNVLAYAPDNTHALYFGASTFVHMEREAEALKLLELLIASTTDRSLLNRAEELKTSLGRSIAPTPESPR